MAQGNGVRVISEKTHFCNQPNCLRRLPSFKPYLNPPYFRGAQSHCGTISSKLVKWRFQAVLSLGPATRRVSSTKEGRSYRWRGVIGTRHVKLWKKLTVRLRKD